MVCAWQSGGWLAAKAKCIWSKYYRMVSPVVKNGLLYQSRELVEQDAETTTQVPLGRFNLEIILESGTE